MGHFEHFQAKNFHFQKILTIFRRPPPASILAFLQSDFACRSHGTGAILRRVFRQILGTFRGQKVHFSAILDHFFDFSRQFLSRSLVRAHKTTHQHMPNNFVFHHIPILGPKKYPPPDWVTVSCRPLLLKLLQLQTNPN